MTHLSLVKYFSVFLSHLFFVQFTIIFSPGWNSFTGLKGKDYWIFVPGDAINKVAMTMLCEDGLSSQMHVSVEYKVCTSHEILIRICNRLLVQHFNIPVLPVTLTQKYMHLTLD